MDAGAIGSLVADYPLQLVSAGRTADHGDGRSVPAARYFHKGGFFQDIIHSGINAYLTLDVAQTLLRAGDARYRDLMETVARLATAYRSVARGDSSADARRLHGRRAARLGGGRVGHDDPQLFRARGRRSADRG